MPSNPFRATLTAASSTAGFTLWVPDTDQTSPINIGIVGTSSAALYTVEHSFDYTGSSVFISSNATWFTILSTTANSTIQFTLPTSIIRIQSSNASTGTQVTVTIIQAG